MKFERGFLRSKVARRVFGLFVLSALLPMAITAALSLFQVSKVLTEQRQDQLLHISKNYSMAVLERLQLAQARLEEIGALVGDENVINTVQHRWRNQFEAVALISDEGTTTSLLGNLIPPAALQQTQPQSVKSQLIVNTVSGYDSRSLEPQVFIRLKPSAESSDQRRVLAQLSARYLWGDPDTLPYMTDVCVLSQDQYPLYCSRVMSEMTFTHQAMSEHSGQLQWREDNETYLAAYRESFLQNQFDYPGWTVVVFQPKSHALAAVAGFNQFFPLIIVGAILLVLFLSVSQIRKHLVPLEKLMAGTRQLANQRFFTTVDVTSDDEFGDLAQAFNTMSAQIGRQFNALDTLAQIDRLILTNPDFEGIVEIILKHVPAIVPCDSVAILLAKPETSGAFQVYLKACHRDSEPVSTELSLTSAQQASVLADPQPFMALTTAACPYLMPLSERGAKACYVLPIVSKNRLFAMVLLGYSQPQALTQDDKIQARDLADRIAVALAAWEREKKLYYQAHYDALTGLPNRTFLLELLNREIAHGQRQGHLVALLFIDLDRFKNVNDSMGHAAGDQLLEQTALRLSDCVRAADSVARLGGDEFTILLTELSQPRDAVQVAEKIIRAMSKPFMIYGQEHFVSASIGIAIHPYDGVSGAELMRNADTAMYRAKHDGRGRAVFFQEAMNTEAVERTRMESDLRRALERNELSLHYQPKLDVSTNTITSAEVLVRWHHPERGWVPPSVFVTLAEEIGLVETMGEWVLRQACRQWQAWQTQGLGLERVAVNVSSLQFKQADFAATVASILADENLPPSCLELEITESLFLENDKQLSTMLGAFRDMGITLALDDFGTGYSSLIYLNQFPVDTIKVDRAFMENIPADRDATALVDSIFTLASSLNKTVVVEGVETEQQMDFVCNSRATYVQGFYLSRPVNADDFVAFVERYNHNVEAALSA